MAPRWSSLSFVDAEHPVGQIGHLLQVRVQRRRIEQRIVLHDQEAVVVLLQDGHELEGGEGAAYLQFGEFAVQSLDEQLPRCLIALKVFLVLDRLSSREI
jgi:hypothetical protein